MDAITENVDRVVWEVVAEETDFPIHDLTHMTRIEDVAVDSLDRLNMLFEIEKRLDVPLRDHDFSSFQTVGDMCRLATRLKAEAYG